MTKKQVWERFYNLLSDEEKADWNNLPDFVVHIAECQPKLSPEQVAWGQEVMGRINEGAHL